jgi:peptide/nickel transport system substrate-binding protein
VPAHVVEQLAGVSDLLTVPDADLPKVADAWNNGFKADTFQPATFVSGMPYVITSVRKGDSVTLTRNKRYYGPAAQLDSLTFKLLIDDDAEVQAMQAGTVQLATPIPTADVLTKLAAVSGVTVIRSGGSTLENLTINFANPLFQDLAVRQAFALCVPRQQIVDQLIAPLDPSAQVAGNHLFFPFQKEYVDNSGAYKASDLAKAKSILEADGWVLNGDVYEKDGKPLAFKILRKDPDDRRRKEVQLITSSCAGAGMKVSDDPDQKFASTRLPDGKFDVALFGWARSPTLATSRAVFDGGGALNYGKYIGTNQSALWDTVDNELDDAQRLAAAQKIDKQLWTDLASIPLYQFPDVVAAGSGLQGVVYNPSPAGITWNASSWKLAR